MFWKGPLIGGGSNGWLSWSSRKLFVMDRYPSPICLSARVIWGPANLLIPGSINIGHSATACSTRAIAIPYLSSSPLKESATDKLCMFCHQARLFVLIGCSWRTEEASPPCKRKSGGCGFSDACSRWTSFSAKSTQIPRLPGEVFLSVVDVCAKVPYDLSTIGQLGTLDDWKEDRKSIFRCG